MILITLTSCNQLIIEQFPYCAFEKRDTFMGMEWDGVLLLQDTNWKSYQLSQMSTIQS